LEYKDEVVINADNDVEDFVEEEPPEKRAARQKNGTAEEADDDEVGNGMANYAKSALNIFITLFY
jgi:hypothetical protein